MQEEYVSIVKCTSTVKIGISTDGLTRYYRHTGFDERGIEYEYHTEMIKDNNGFEHGTLPHSFTKLTTKGK